MPASRASASISSISARDPNQCTGARRCSASRSVGKVGRRRTGAEVVAVVDGVRQTFRVPEGQLRGGCGPGRRRARALLVQGRHVLHLPAKLVEGEVAMLRNFSLESWEVDAGFVLTCQAQPRSSRVVLDYDAM